MLGSCSLWWLVPVIWSGCKRQKGGWSQKVGSSNSGSATAIQPVLSVDGRERLLAFWEWFCHSPTVIPISAPASFKCACVGGGFYGLAVHEALWNRVCEGSTVGHGWAALGRWVALVARRLEAGDEMPSRLAVHAWASGAAVDTKGVVMKWQHTVSKTGPGSSPNKCSSNWKLWLIRKRNTTMCPFPEQLRARETSAQSL